MQAKSTFVSGSSETELVGKGAGAVEGAGDGERLIAALEAETCAACWPAGLPQAIAKRTSTVTHFPVINTSTLGAEPGLWSVNASGFGRFRSLRR